jgi:hypothetical protein
MSIMAKCASEATGAFMPSFSRSLVCILAPRVQQPQVHCSGSKPRRSTCTGSPGRRRCRAARGHCQLKAAGPSRSDQDHQIAGPHPRPIFACKRCSQNCVLSRHLCTGHLTMPVSFHSVGVLPKGAIAQHPAGDDAVLMRLIPSPAQCMTAAHRYAFAGVVARRARRRQSRGQD